MQTRNILIVVILWGSFLSLAKDQKTHPFSVQDMVSMQRVSSPAPSPDGKWVIYTRWSFDLRANESTTNLWLVSTDGKTNSQLTFDKHKSNSSPVWSKDSSTVAFISNKSGSSQIWMMDIEVKKPYQLTRMPLDVSNLSFSPSGKHLAFSADVYPRQNSLKQSANFEKALSKKAANALVFNQLMVRHWDTWHNGKRRHIFVLPVAKRKKSKKWFVNGRETDLMQGVEGDSPTKPFGGVEDYAWSPDGKEIAYTAHLGRDQAWTTDLDVFIVPVSGGKAVSITLANMAMDQAPSYSPDGTSIAYLAMMKPGFEADQRKITLYDRKKKKLKFLNESWDLSPDSIAWSLDSKTIYATAQHNARKKIFAVNVATGEPSEIVSSHYNSNVSVLKDRLIYLQDSFSTPADIWSSSTDGGDSIQLTRSNLAIKRLMRISEAEEFHFNGAQNDLIQAWIFKPVNFIEGKKYPVAFVIHGGPQGAFMDHFSYRWNPQALAGAGFAVIMVNFHGSTGFGQKFTDSISGDWGGKPYDDLMLGLDYALGKYTWLDSNRVAALGASFGGWMINWINGHTDRFRCLVNHDGLFDLYSMYYSTEELWFPEWEMQGTPYKNPELYDKFSPSKYVDKWKTPTLVIHGEKDYRVPITEGIATFTALQRKGVPSRFLYFPSENHWVLNPNNSIVWHKEVLSWLEKWLSKERLKPKVNNAFE